MIQVLVGTNSLELVSSTSKYYEVENAFGHQNFSFETTLNDIGLIKLKNSIEFNENVNSIKLPRDKSFEKANDHAVATGWGISRVIINTTS